MSEFKNTIGVLGHFGGNKEFFDGQTVKTKEIYRALEVKTNSIQKVDTYGYKKRILGFFINVINLLLKCKNVVFMLDENGIKVIIPLYSLLNKIYKRNLHYVVIGGWLPVYLKKHKIVCCFAKKIDNIYVETTTMKEALEEQGFTNIVVMPNCKNLKILQESELNYSINTPYKFCTFSRVMKEKGIEDAIEAVSRVNEKYNKTVCTLDIYGQIDPEQTEWFNNLVLPEYVKYAGIVDYDKSVDALKDYFALLFPTKFYTEGIPGTLIDAYAAGVPVITSLWQNSRDVFTEGVTGWGYEFDNTDRFYYLVEKAVQQPEEFLKMKNSCIKEAEKFMPEKAIEVLLQRLL